MVIKPLHDAEGVKFCDEIELGEFNLVQPYGALLVLDINLHILQVSENVLEILETPCDDLFNQSILTYLSPEFTEDKISDWFNKSKNKSTSLRAFWIRPDKKISLLAFIHFQSDLIILEIERSRENRQDYSMLFNSTKFVNKIVQSKEFSTSNELGQAYCDEIKKLFGFHRVLVYKFDKHNHSGLVTSEALDENMESYLGLHFPANDVPKSVREMYLSLPIRYIPTILDNPVKVIPYIHSGTKTVIDLKNINLRMVAPVHVKYIANMGICSSTSIAIIQNGVLWGLIACHHRTPKYLSLNHRIILIHFAVSLASQITGIETRQNQFDENKAVELQTAILLRNTESLSEMLNKYHNEWMQQLSATGMTMYLDEVLINYGETPNNKDIEDLVTWLEKKEEFITYTTFSLPLEYKKSMAFKDKASGLLAIKISPASRDYLLFYKPEYISETLWAGNPSNALKMTDNSYSPRDSFARFLETIVNQSSPWTNIHLKWAALIHSLVITKQLQDYLKDLSIHDHLTQLLNRYTLDQTLDMQIRRAERSRSSVAVVMIDIDKFKTINDTFGHQIGDNVLKSTAKLITKTFRMYDYIYRYGGDEFVVIIADVSLSTATEKALNLLKQTNKIKIKGIPPVTLSMGISIYPEHAITARELIAKADDALYRSKANGRNQVTCWDGK